MRTIRMIWDFKGHESLEFAKHHAKHLKEFVEKNNIDCINAGEKVIHEMHSIAYLDVSEQNLTEVRDALKPHRGEWVENNKES